MAINVLLKRSATASKRPDAASMAFGEVDINYNSSTGGLFYKNSAGSVVKVGPAEVGTTAPNSSPAGSSGNSAGEFWYDTTNSVLKIWTGSAWVDTVSTSGLLSTSGGSMTGNLYISNSELQVESTSTFVSSGTATFTGTTDLNGATSFFFTPTWLENIGPASQVTYDNTSSGLAATEVQSAINELASGSWLPAASTSTPGIVQLNDTTSSTSTTQALTANQGRELQEQINALSTASNIILAGTIDASTGNLVTVTTQGTAEGFVIGDPLPAAASGNENYFVIVTIPGTMTPPGGSAQECHQGDWWLSSGTIWEFLDVGFNATAATTTTPGVVQLATDAEVQAGLNTDHAVTPSGLQSKVSDSTGTTSSTSIASSTAVKDAYDAGIQGQTDAASAQADATQALLDAAAAQADATQALTDAAAAQTDATQALSDASAAQADATQALSDAAAAQATADAAMPKAGGTFTGDVTFYGGIPGGGVILTLDNLTAGDGYSEGIYSGVALEGGSGSGATATIDVNASGEVTSVTLDTGGSYYVVGDTLTLDLPTSGTEATIEVGTTTPIVLGATIIDGNGSSGTPGQVLSTNNNNALCWAGPMIPEASFTQKGTLLAGLGAGSYTEVGPGSSGQILSYVNAKFGCNVMWVDPPAIAQPSQAGLSFGYNDTTVPTGNLSVGQGSLSSVGFSTGCQNTAFGAPALQNLSSGSDNVVFGFASGNALTIECNNVAIGSQIGISKAFSDTVVIGTCAGTCATNSVFIGHNALNIALRSCDSVVIGGNALNDNPYTGCQLVAIGPNVTIPAFNDSCQLAIGFSATENWLTGDCTKAIKPGAGILDGANSTGTDGQVLMSNGANAICWGDVPAAWVDSRGVVFGFTSATGFFQNESAYFGFRAGNNPTFTQCGNSSLGTCSLGSITASASCNTAVGYRSLFGLTASCFNTAIGALAASGQTGGTQNVAIGYNVNLPVTNGSCQLAIGFENGCNWLTGTSSKAIRPGAGIIDCTGSCGGAGQVLMSDGSNAICWGTAGGGSNATPTVAGLVLGCTTATRAAIGSNALASNTSGANNTALGVNALTSNVTGSFNTAVGDSALRLSTGDRNTAVGHNSLCSNTSGAGNTAFGQCSLFSNLNGSGNTTVGWLSLCGNTGGGFNTAVGINALRNNTTGANNVGVGNQAIFTATTGCCNVGVGTNSLQAMTSGCFNTAIGASSLVSVTTGCGNIGIGGLSSTGASVPVFTVITENDRIVMGTTAVTNAYIQVAWQLVSDARDKIVSGDVPHGLEFVKNLEPKAFHFKLDREVDEPHGPLRYGFLAQDVLALEGESPVIIDNEDDDKLRMTDTYLIPVLVNAIKELSAKNDELEARLRALETLE